MRRAEAYAKLNEFEKALSDLGRINDPTEQESRRKEKVAQSVTQKQKAWIHCYQFKKIPFLGLKNTKLLVQSELTFKIRNSRRNLILTSHIYTMRTSAYAGRKYEKISFIDLELF